MPVLEPLAEWLSDPETPLAAVAAVVAAIVAGISSVSVYAVGRRAELRDARRAEVADAYATASSWLEAVYRVRRRHRDEQHNLAERLSDLQDEIYSQRGLLATRSVVLARAYEQYVDAIKVACAEPLKDAWDGGVREIENWTLNTDVHPDERDAEGEFLTAARRHLSGWILPRLLPWWKYRVMWREAAATASHDTDTPSLTSTNADDTSSTPDEPHPRSTP